MADSIQPNPFTIDPAGNVQVVGLDLPAGTSQTPPAQSRVRWIRQSDGAVLAEQLGTEYGVPTPQAQLQQIVYALSGDSSASLEISAQQSGSPDWFTQLLLICNPAGQVAKVNAQANDGAGNTHVATIIDSAGESSFLQMLNIGGYRLSYGVVGVGVPAGWSTQSAPIGNYTSETLLALGFPVGGAGASINAWSVSTWSLNAVSIFINSAIAQTIDIYTLALGK